MKPAISPMSGFFEITVVLKCFTDEIPLRIIQS